MKKLQNVILVSKEAMPFVLEALKIKGIDPDKVGAIRKDKVYGSDLGSLIELLEDDPELFKEDIEENTKEPLVNLRIQSRLGSSKDTPVCKECGVIVFHKFIHRSKEDKDTNLVTCDVCYEQLTGTRIDKELVMMKAKDKLIPFKELEKLIKENPLISAICKDRINYIKENIRIDLNGFEIRIKKND